MPKRGRSPLRIAICALCMRRRSMVASRRPNSEAEGTRMMEAVLDIVVPFSVSRSSSASSSGINLCIPDASHNRLVCIAAISRLHCSINTLFGIPNNEKGRREPAAFRHFQREEGGLLRRLLSRRVERAGIVDLGDLVIGEAEHLAQDLVGVLAEQRGTGHLAR